jgi:hypothetical protein
LQKDKKRGSWVFVIWITNFVGKWETQRSKLEKPCALIQFEAKFSMIHFYFGKKILSGRLCQSTNQQQEQPASKEKEERNKSDDRK